MSGAIKPIAMRDAFLKRILGAMESDPSIFFLTADFGSPVLDELRRNHGGRFCNVGVAEQNLVNVAAGLALEGYNVFAYAIAPFITMRCFEQIRVNLCLLSQVRRMSVTLIGVGAGYSYVVSGPTHQCYEDISIMRTLPTVRVLSPSDHVQTAALFDQCRSPGIRYLRLDAQLLEVISAPNRGLAREGFRVVLDAEASVVIVSTGYMTHTALQIAALLSLRGIICKVIDQIDLSTSAPVALAHQFADARLVVSLEEGFISRGGLDAMIQASIRLMGRQFRFMPFGVPPGYSFELGSRQELHAMIGISPEAIATDIVAALNETVQVP